jgi:N-methylhydantoinase A
LDLLRAGVDIGGTFTDIVLMSRDGRVYSHKLLSTPSDYCAAIIGGLDAVFGKVGQSSSNLDSLVHATTIATNIILEKRGARLALVTTEGFRDVLEMRRLRIPRLYDLQYVKPEPLVPRHMRFEIAERIGPDGSIWRPLDEQALDTLAQHIAAQGVEAVAVALLHSYANPAHEHRVAASLRARLPSSCFICCSADILSEIREYERTSTATVNAYVGPAVSRYLGTLMTRLAGAGINAPVHVMESGGGVMPAALATLKPAQIVESGPAAGVIACARLSEQIGQPNVISFDMGGTTAKAAMIEGGEPAKTTEFEVGAGISLSSKLVKGGGYAIKLPFIDVSEIGAGGGSIVSIDAAGALKVGPESAGADPGPACYSLGGERATLTDCLVTLGHLNPLSLAGGTVPIDAELARDVVMRDVGTPLGLGLVEAADGVLEIAVANMTRAVKAVSTYRGRDPRDFALIAFGGNGPVVGAAIARALGLRKVIVPPSPGVFSAAGLLFSRVEREFSETVFKRVEKLDPKTVDVRFDDLIARGIAVVSSSGSMQSDFEITRRGDFRYAGQAYELTVGLEDGLAAAVEEFHAEHERTFGYRSESSSVDLVNLRVLISVRGSGAAAPTMSHHNAVDIGESDRPAATRSAYFGAGFGTFEIKPFGGRAALGASWQGGPIIIEEYDSTCIVPPDGRARLDSYGNIEISFA